jgi:hypothetical protein
MSIKTVVKSLFDAKGKVQPAQPQEPTVATAPVEAPVVHAVPDLSALRQPSRPHAVAAPVLTAAPVIAPAPAPEPAIVAVPIQPAPEPEPRHGCPDAPAPELTSANVAQAVAAVPASAADIAPALVFPREEIRQIVEAYLREHQVQPVETPVSVQPIEDESAFDNGARIIRGSEVKIYVAPPAALVPETGSGQEPISREEFDRREAEAMERVQRERAGQHGANQQAAIRFDKPTGKSEWTRR